MNLLGVTRSSNQEVAEGYGPAIQESELVSDAATNGYGLIAVRHVVEPATIKLEERKLFKAVMAEAMNLKKDGLGNGLCFSRVDRLSRQFEAAVQIALDCRKHGLTLRFVRENQWLRPDDEPIHFVMFILHALGVDTKTKVDRASLKGGQHKAAEAGKLPAGVGPGFLGYTLVNKHFEPDTFIAVCDEVLDRGIQGHLGGQYLQKLT